MMNILFRSIILTGLFGLFTIPIKAQTFEPRESTHRTKGLAEFGDQILAYGTGLIWMDTEGKILDKKRIIEGAVSSDFRKGVSDQKGGAWLLSRKGLTHINENKKATTVFTTEEINHGDLKDLKAMPDGSVYCLARGAVLKVKPDFSYTEIFTNSNEKSLYFNHFDLAADGHFYIASYKEVFKLSPSGEISTYKLKGNPSFKDIQCTEDGKVIILEYKNIYQLKDKEIIPFIMGHQIARGLKIYEAVFTRSDDFWLYCYQGNVFRNDKGTWKNYVPPEGLRTGNFGEDILKSTDGNIWMSLAGYSILKFDNNKWSRFDIDKETALPALSNASLQNNNALLSYDSKNKTLYRSESGEMLAWKKIKMDKARNFKTDAKNNIYWTTQNGLFTLKNGVEKKIIEHAKISNYSKIGEDFVYSDNDKIYLYSKGEAVSIDNNQHYLGWEKVYSPKMHHAFDNTIILSSSSRRGLISLYNGKEWKKVIQVDGKKLKPVTHIFTYKESTHLILEDHQIVRYDSNGWHWVDRPQVEKSIKYPKAQMSTDGSIWLFDINENITVLKDGEISKIDMPLKEKGINPRAITKVDENIYDIYMDGTVLRCTL